MIEPPTPRDRADRVLVALGFFESRASARAAIEAGRVRVGGVLITKPAHMISPGDQIEADAAHPYVSRGGIKLAHALGAFGIDPAGRICLDIGASTGGFSDVLLRGGAACVYAVDVGHGQLHPRLLERVIAKVETGFAEHPAQINRLELRRDSITPQQGLERRAEKWQRFSALPTRQKKGLKHGAVAKKTPDALTAPRLHNLERTDARALTPDHFRAAPDLIVCDASFISLAKLLAVPLSLAAPGADLIALFKPQFEVGRGHVGKGGIVSDFAAADAAAGALADWLTQRGWPVQAWTASPIAGGDGNTERLLHARHLQV
jgi:predicted rRNA methylase YqxC with S4 and FtsJ domains